MNTWPYILTCILCWACWSIVQKVVLSGSSPMMIQLITAYVYSAIAPAMFMYMKATGRVTNWSVRTISWTVVSCLLIVTGALSFSTAVQKAPVSSVVAWTSTYPLLSVLMCWAFLGEPVGTLKAVGMLVVVVGLVLLNL